MMKAITVCVNFGDILSLTLPRNAPHVHEILVVSHPDDRETAAVVQSVPNARLFTTDVFYRDGAAFAKGRAMEEGFEALGRSGWMMVLDADVILPSHFGDAIAEIRPGYLYSPRRRMLADPRQFSDLIDWEQLPIAPDQEWAGYCQIFHAKDPHLIKRPWYGTRWMHAGGCDSDFSHRWSPSRMLRPPFHVLHLGEDGVNWCGRVTPRLDGTVPAEAGQRSERLRQIKAERDSTGRNDHEKFPRKRGERPTAE